MAEESTEMAKTEAEMKALTSNNDDNINDVDMSTETSPTEGSTSHSASDDASSESEEAPLETGFYYPKKKGKRTRSSKASDKIKVRKTVVTKNRFDPLTVDPPAEEATVDGKKATKEKKKPYIPPFNIVIDEKSETFSDLRKLIKICEFPPVIVNKPRSNEMAVSTATLTDYRKLQGALEKENFSFYTFKDPEAVPPIKAVIRHLPITASVGDIKEELTDDFHKFSVLNVAQMRKNGQPNGAPLPLFVVTLKNEPHSKEIKNLRTLLYVRISVEDFHKPNVPMQCYTCQRYHHVSSQCKIPPRCVKCAGDHLTSTCEKSKETPSKCANCGDTHTASYRGCPAYKYAKKAYSHKLRSSPQAPPKNNKNPPADRNFPRLPTRNQTQQYQRKTSTENHQQTEIPPATTSPTYAQKALPNKRPQQHQHAQKPHPTPKPTIPQDTNLSWTQQLGDLLNNLNTLIFDIMSGSLTKQNAIREASRFSGSILTFALQNGCYAENP